MNISKCLILFFATLFFSISLEAQDNTQTKKNQRFFELNVGVAIIDDDFGFPGFSLMWGRRFITDSNIVLEYELGLAFPTLITGKAGVGYNLGPVNLTAGVRPFPFTTYFQIAQSNGKRGNWMISFEKNPLDKYSSISVSSVGNINVGFRWNLN